jgi:undecaprenyl-diphosphatase
MSVPLTPLLVLALLQGVMEFLPISSEGQLLLISVGLFGIDPAIAFSIAIWLHLGTAIAVILFYRRDIFSRFYKGSRSEVTDSGGVPPKLFGPLFSFVAIATIGTVIVALPLYLLIRELVPRLMGEMVSLIIGVLLLVTGVVLYFQRKRSGSRHLNDISLTEAFLLGIVQGFAVLPGISRSGMTLTWLLLRGVEDDDALRLSFLAGVPASLGVVGLDFILGEVFWAPILVLVLITLIALVVGIATLLVLRYTAIHAPFWAFCLTIGFIVIALEATAVIGLITILP